MDDNLDDTGEGFEVWDLVSGNAITDFATEAEALAFVRRAITQLGREQVCGWGMSRPDDVSESLSGEDLVDLALQPTSPWA